ncbi:hypothetical protein [Bradyrhizobium canariense]|uniref:hypothetical protein n=1 Tax=Bradyrhizobium canariense TaxID=255045 RepID=UPI000A198BBC|nr:hypothetical protein [Bradyrhizobium canariense]OSI32787.1 hypothetical protein BST65_03765 [Bradyrhizobium canariense]OSI36867.1 hypothetical protein BST66_05360 [Bradyrhizobium canariense]OSI49984.1 hypothetical protein BSZ20_06355 [Bradyrhizobium canariense]OSI55588.1 hypothetical protein BST67_04960 [Bradyrhizobium canariense]OSI58969.1 hypothetical protein BSZ15_07085 [Bradyrhizobium canariense]
MVSYCRPRRTERNGKSTLLHLISDRLIRDGIRFEQCSNNDSGRWSTVIRELASAPDRPLTLALATAAARAELKEGAHRPQLCDRFVVSTLVYQRFAGLPLEYLYATNRPLLAASVTFVLRVDAAPLLARRGCRARKPDWFKDRLGVDEEVGLYDQATALLTANGHDVRVMDASGDEVTLAAQLAAEIAPILQRSGAS